MKSIAINASAINAVERYLAKRAGESTPEQHKFWFNRVLKYRSLHDLSEMDQSIEWHYPGRQKPALANKEPLAHLPVVGVGFEGCGDTGVWKYDIRGEMAFRESPAELAERAKDATEVHLTINTSGGCGRWAVEFGARLRALGVPIITTAQRAFSAGALLLQAGTVRRVKADGAVMVHGPQYACVGSAEDFEREAAMLRKDRLNDLELYSVSTGQPRETIEAWLSSDTYFSPDEAVAAGLADVVV